jgi:hypothetical protein
LLDPGRGARRRGRIRDVTAHAATVTKRAFGKTGRDARHRAYGTAASLRSLVRHGEVDDQVLAERVRASSAGWYRTPTRSRLPYQVET